MKILMLSCHSVLEYDEVRLLHELGHEVFSPGAYVEPANPGDSTLRPAIPGLVYDPEDLAAYHALWKDGYDNKARLTREFVSRFDLVIVMHVPEWIEGNWHALEGTPTIWRTIGQSIDKQEAQLAPFRAKGLKIVRYSPAEERIPGYIGADAMIRFYKDPAEYDGWTGATPAVLHVGQDVIKRGKACSYEFVEKVTRPFPRTLIGEGSKAVDWGIGKVPFEALKGALQTFRVFMYSGTHPASYTLGFIEALMTGIPVVSVGRNHGNSPDIPGHRLFEVPDVLDGTNGLASDDPFEIQDFISHMLMNPVAAKSVGANGRRTAIELFGKTKIAAEWASFLKGIG